MSEELCCSPTIWPQSGLCVGGACVCSAGQSNGNAWGVEDVCSPDNLLADLCFAAMAVCFVGAFITGRILWGSRQRVAPTKVRPETSVASTTTTRPQIVSSNYVSTSSRGHDARLSSDFKTVLLSGETECDHVKTSPAKFTLASRETIKGPNSPSSPRKKASNVREMRQFIAAAFGYFIVLLVLAVLMLCGLRLDTVFFLIPVAMLVIYSRTTVLLKAFVKVLPKPVLNSEGGGLSQLSENEIKYLLNMREWLDANDAKITAFICLPLTVSIFWSMAPANEPGYDEFILTEMVIFFYLSAILFMASRAATKVFTYLIDDIEKSIADNSVELGKGDNSTSAADAQATVRMYKKVKLLTTTMCILDINSVVFFSILLPVLTFIPALKERLFNSPEAAFLPLYMILLPFMVSIICVFIVPSSLR